MIILASNSQLRKMIMEASGLPFEVIAKDIDERRIERQHKDKEASEIAQLLAITKAQEISYEYPGRAVVAADTFGVLSDGTRLHKGKNLDDSIRMAMKQSGQTVTVYTGTAVVYREKSLSTLTSTKITYSNFDDLTVRQLFDINEAAKRRNAALGFFTDAPGFTLVEKIEGSYLGAMGLPMDVVRRMLLDIGYSLE